MENPRWGSALFSAWRRDGKSKARGDLRGRCGTNPAVPAHARAPGVGNERCWLTVRSAATTRILAALFWAAGAIYSKSFPGSGSILPRIGIQMLTGGIFECIAGFIMGESLRFHFTTQSLMAYLYLIVFGSLIGYGSFVYVIHHWPAAKAGTYAYINPVVAVILGAIILKEPVTVTMIVASAIILGGVFLVQLSRYKLKKPEDGGIPGED